MAQGALQNCPGADFSDVHFVAHKSEIEADVRIARGESLGMQISGDSAPVLAGFVPGVAEVVVDGWRFGAALDETLITGRGFCELALLVELIGLLEFRIRRSRVEQGREAEKENEGEPKSRATLRQSPIGN